MRAARLLVALAALALAGCAMERTVENGPNGPEVNRLSVWPGGGCCPR